MGGIKNLRKVEKKKKSAADIPKNPTRKEHEKNSFVISFPKFRASLCGPGTLFQANSNYRVYQVCAKSQRTLPGLPKGRSQRKRRTVARIVYDISNLLLPTYQGNSWITHQGLETPNNTTRKLMEPGQGNYCDSTLHKVKK